MGLPNQLPALEAIVAGHAVFSADMPVWLGAFGADKWPFIDESSPLWKGTSSSSLVWRDYIEGRGAALNHPSSFAKTKYSYCLTPEIIDDLKIAATIHAFFPKLLKDSRSTKPHVDPKTVKGRIEELAKFFSLVIIKGRTKHRLVISSLRQISFPLLKEVISEYPGRGAHLKRALKLISDPAVQRNLSGELQWGLLDITKSYIVWPDSPNEGGIATLPDSHFLFLLDSCKRAVARFKWIQGMQIHDVDCRELAPTDNVLRETLRNAVAACYSEKAGYKKPGHFHSRFGVTATVVANLIRDAHVAALLLVLLFTGMRSSETLFLMQDCLTHEYGYWFLKSKVVKGQPKDIPVSEGWLAIDLTRDAYDILNFFCRLTGNAFLFSTPFPGYHRSGKGYANGMLNTKFTRWIKSIDTTGIFSGWRFSIHQCRETLVSQLAKQEVGLPFISMQLKHFQSQFNRMPNAVTAGYGQYRAQLMTSVANRIVEARESALLDVYGEDASFAGGGAAKHKARIDAFFAGLGLFGESRVQYIKAMAKRGVKLMPTSIGSCTKNFIASAPEPVPPCYGDYQCDPDCGSHVITERCANALLARKQHALIEAHKEVNPDYKVIWTGLAQKLDLHIQKLQREGRNA